MGLFYIKSFVFLSRQHAYGEVAYKNDMHYTPNYIFELIGKTFKNFFLRRIFVGMEKMVRIVNLDILKCVKNLVNMVIPQMVAKRVKVVIISTLYYVNILWNMVHVLTKTCSFTHIKNTVRGNNFNSQLKCNNFLKSSITSQKCSNQNIPKPNSSTSLPQNFINKVRASWTRDKKLYPTIKFITKL